MKNKMAIAIMKDISKQYEQFPAEKRAFDKAIASLEYCEKHKLTYYVEGKYYGEKTD